MGVSRASLSRHGARIARPIARRFASMLPIAEPGWAALDREITLWGDQGPSVWWRDDDAVDATPALDRLLALRARLGIPLALAVIPVFARPALVKAVAAQGGPDVRILPHGWNHDNHAPEGAAKSELAAGRNPAEVESQLTRGRRRLERLFGDRILPVLVPPFNLIAPHLIASVRKTGFTHLSVDGDFTGLDFPTRNVHVDIIDWNKVSAVPTAQAVRDVVMALRLRRYGLIARASPIGIMTHHLAHDEAAWSLAQELLSRIAGRRTVVFPPIEGIFAS
jgi:hypothetical protein